MSLAKVHILFFAMVSSSGLFCTVFLLTLGASGPAAAVAALASAIAIAYLVWRLVAKGEVTVKAKLGDTRS